VGHDTFVGIPSVEGNNTRE